ncbi:hypothetical protein ACLB1S_22145 [Escherichia coli]
MDKIALICAKADAEKKLRDLAVAEAAQRRLIAELEAKTRLKLMDMAFHTFPALSPITGDATDTARNHHQQH